MSDKQDSNDDIQSISVKFQSITTDDANLDSQEQVRFNQSVSKVNSGASTRTFQDKQKMHTTDDNVPMKNLPELNLPEKIIFVIDTVKEHDCTQFKLGTGAKYPPLYMIKRVVEIFISAKLTIECKHEFAIMTLDSESAHWICDFTSNVKAAINHVNAITEEASEGEQETYDLGRVFEKISVHATLPIIDETLDTLPFIVRVIFIYSRSHSVPQFQSNVNHFERLMENPLFFVDSLFVHEPPSADNKCEEIYAELATLDVKNLSYILEVGRNATKLHDNMAKLVAHPLQRPLQKDACYTLYNSMISQEVHTNV